MRIEEYSLECERLLIVFGKKKGVMRMKRSSEINNILEVSFVNGTTLQLPYAVDISETLSFPRVFILEGALTNDVAIFGGEKVYWINAAEELKQHYDLFRSAGNEEYWVTTIIHVPTGLIIVYEAGVIAFDEALVVQWHIRKYWNDEFIGQEGDLFNFMGEDDKKWSVRVVNGEIIK